jgi:hypothetical protein
MLTLDVVSRGPTDDGIDWSTLTGQAAAQKKKGIETFKYPFKIAECHMGSPSFMEGFEGN